MSTEAFIAVRREGQPMPVESINSYTTVLYMVLGLASLYQCADCGAPINQSMSDEVKVLIIFYWQRRSIVFCTSQLTIMCAREYH